jgi:hypothetical protein
MITFSFVVAILILLLIFAPGAWVVYSQRKLPPSQRLSSPELLTRLASSAAVASVPLSIIALVLSWGLQLRNEAAARGANEEAGRYAAEQERLLEQSVTALNQAATLLKEQAEASKSAASYLERQYAIQSSQRQEELQRRAMVPDIRPALELVGEGGSTDELAVLSRTSWSNYDRPFEVRLKPGSVRFEMDLRVINSGRATLREGFVSLRSGFQQDVLLGFSNHSPSIVESLDIPLKNLRPMRQASSFFADRISVFVPKPNTGNKRLFNMFLHFEGDEAERRDGNLWFEVHFDVERTDGPDASP